MAISRSVLANGLVLFFSTQVWAGINPAITTDRVASGLSLPTFVTHAPGDFDHLFIVEKIGRIRVMNMATEALSTVMDINSQVGGGTTQNDERGLLGMAFHPDYANNGFFYLYYTNNTCNASGGCNTVVARFSVIPDTEPPQANTTATVLLNLTEPQSNHNGGWIGFGPNDGYLYIARGDGGNFCDTGTGHTTGTGNAQDITTNLLGKMLRIDVDGNNGPGGAYGIPADNPFVGVSGDDEIWAYGLRNPWRDSFDRATGDLWIADVGQDVVEEINFQPASSTGGENYGWRCMEGNSCSSVSGCSTTGCTCDPLSRVLTLPIDDYVHSGGSCSVTGGYVYRGCAVEGLQGKYFYSDFCSATVWSLRYDGVVVSDFQTFAAGSLNPPGAAISFVSAFGEDAYGEVYIVDHGTGTNGEVFRIIPNFPLAAENDCNTNSRHDDCEILDGSEPDADMNGILDVCEIPPCVTVADCADTDQDGVRDNPCSWYECAAGTCLETPRTTQGDMAGEFGTCTPDQVCDSHDQYHALNCFSDQDTSGIAGYPCEGSPPAALNVDASGAFGNCDLDGICDASDAFSALNCFTDQDSRGQTPYPCTCNGPQPSRRAGHQPAPASQTRVSLRAPRVAAPGDVIDVHVYFDDPLKDVRGYQLHLGVAGGTGRTLNLIDVSSQPQHAGHVFGGQEFWSAFNVRTAQMTAGLTGAGVRTAAPGYLATFTYQIPQDAAGTYVIDLLYDDQQAVPEERTFLFASPLQKIGIQSATTARLTVAARSTRRAG